jgi:anhydro-N-acetylmuramic acid kinase
MSFDKNGEAGKKGAINNLLLKKLNNLIFYKTAPPKSLGREWLEVEVVPVIQSFNITTEDKLRTVYQHIAKQIALSFKGTGDVLITGGGANNKFLIELISSFCNNNIEIPSNEVIDFKEALIFAFLGVLTNINQVNCLASVTGARNDNIGGVVYRMEKRSEA